MKDYLYCLSRLEFSLHALFAFIAFLYPMATPSAQPFLALLAKYGDSLYHAIFQYRSASTQPFHATPPPPISKAPGAPWKHRLSVPDLLGNWPWQESRNSALTDALDDEELGFFLALPEVNGSKTLQSIVKKGFVREFTIL